MHRLPKKTLRRKPMSENDKWVVNEAIDLRFARGVGRQPAVMIAGHGSWAVQASAAGRGSRVHD